MVFGEGLDFVLCSMQVFGISTEEAEGSFVNLLNGSKVIQTAEVRLIDGHLLGELD
jgi:hypothetical protein